MADPVTVLGATALILNALWDGHPSDCRCSKCEGHPSGCRCERCER
jgi:hypothetical protein